MLCVIEETAGNGMCKGIAECVIGI